MRFMKLQFLKNFNCDTFRYYLRNSVKYLLLFIFLNFSCNSKTEKESVLPNVVFILADDIGQGDIGFYHRERTGNAEVIPTPNLDAMISSGIRFDDAHTVSALCS